MSGASRQALRVVVGLATAALTAYATRELARVFPENPLKPAMLGLFVPCFAWSAFGSLLAVLGLAAALWPKAKRACPAAHPGSASPEAFGSAILIPIHNEDPARVAAQVEVMFRALEPNRSAEGRSTGGPLVRGLEPNRSAEGRSTGGPLVRGLEAHAAGRRFDFFLLSDTTDPEVWVAEQAAWRSLCERLAAYGRIFYRRRGKPEAKKAGNIRDFCLRHGADYRYLVVLDADSVVTAPTLCALVDRMESNPRAGIIQVPPLPVRRSTIFARWQQFASRVYGPLWAEGEALLAGPDGNYFGHNAIIRTEAFSSHAGLSKLPGRGPLSGLIASHDFVEAALVRRAGYEVWLATDLGGSYEQSPTNLIDYAIRDKRWCQGNLQHLRVALLPGLAAWSRVHLLRGACSYLIPPLSLAFVSVVLLLAAHDQAFEPTYFLPANRTLFPLWRVYDFAAARGLIALTVGILFGPRIVAAGMSLAAMLRARTLRLRKVPAFFASLLAEFAMGALLSPALMVFQTMFVLASITGERVPWAAQHRNERRLRLGETLRCHWPHVVSALCLGAAALTVSVPALIWTLPLALPLLAAPFLAMLTSSPWLSRCAAALGLFQVPEDWSEDEVLRVYDTPPGTGMNALAVLEDPEACALHALNVIGSGLLQRLPEARRVALRHLLSTRQPLDRSEQLACLTDVDLLLGGLEPDRSANGRSSGGPLVRGLEPNR